MKIYLGADHGGYELKNVLREHLAHNAMRSKTSARTPTTRSITTQNTPTPSRPSSSAAMTTIWEF